MEKAVKEKYKLRKAYALTMPLSRDKILNCNGRTEFASTEWENAILMENPNGRVAQWQSSGLLSHWLQVRSLPRSCRKANALLTAEWVKTHSAFILSRFDIQNLWLPVGEMESCPNRLVPNLYFLFNRIGF